jgi:hypothetical protein
MVGAVVVAPAVPLVVQHTLELGTYIKMDNQQNTTISVNNHCHTFILQLLELCWWPAWLVLWWWHLLFPWLFNIHWSLVPI